MAPFKKDLTSIGRKGKISTHTGKGATEQTLPSRSALSTLTEGDPGARTMQNYAKATPMANPEVDTPDIFGG